MKTLHLIGNAHLDPVWLWRRADGVDAALATARSACDRLDEYPEFVFTASSSWFHEQVEHLDPALFDRVRAFVAGGRWQIVGGMVIQPDCNLPSAESFARQLAVGQAYYRRTFGRPTTVGYNVDSFGHTAYLPRFLRDAGIDTYVFMRPGPHEKALPAPLFRWRSPDGHDVTAFRIAGAYCTWAPDLKGHVETALAAMPHGVDHTMCFFGVGDHGGGPTRAKIDWLREHRGDWPGVRFVFSHPRAFFDAVADHVPRLPVVEGELQHHAIGCYSVERRIKVAMRRAESRLVQAEQAAEVLAGAAGPPGRERIDRAWNAVLFNQFHDMLGGTCIAEASAAVAGELAAAEAEADAVLTHLTRRSFRREARPGEPRLVLFNPSPEPFDGCTSHEPFGAPNPCQLLDERGRRVPHQRIEARSKGDGIPRLLFPITIPARGWRMLRVVPAEAPTQDAPLAFPYEMTGEVVRAGGWTATLDVCDDPSDTWSHSCITRFGGERLGGMAFDDGWETVESGPLRAAVRGCGKFGYPLNGALVVSGEGATGCSRPVRSSRRQAENTACKQAVAPGTAGQAVAPGTAMQGVAPGTAGRDRPWHTIAVISPEVFSVSADPAGVSLTLLRSPYVAHHDPYPAAKRPDHPVTDQGLHEFEVLVAPVAAPDLAEPACMARRMLMPPIAWDLSG
ncbi:MAG: alpha-mannosidase [Planctomycetota bacterium]|nr:alpha-mannosidase [Planctomycetota bacterium]